LTAWFSLQTPLTANFPAFDGVHLGGEHTMHPDAPSWPRHAASLVLAGKQGNGPLRRRPCRAQVLLEPQRSALPGMPITAPLGASNYRFQFQRSQSTLAREPGPVQILRLIPGGSGLQVRSR
jgi:hypothetical protein